MFTEMRQMCSPTGVAASVYRDDRDGRLYEVGYDPCPESPVDIWDGAELFVLEAPRGEDRDDPFMSDNPAMRELAWLQIESRRDEWPSTTEWARKCPDYHVRIGWEVGDYPRLLAIALPKSEYPVDVCRDLAAMFSKWADGFVYYVQPVGEPVECIVTSIFAEDEEDALRQCIENGYFD